GQCPEQLFRKLFRLRRVEVDALAAGDHQYGVSSDGGDAHAERTLVDGGEGVVLDPRALHHVHRFEELFVDAALAEQAGLLEFLVGVAASLYQFFVGIPTVAAAEHGRWFAEVVVFQQHHVGLQTYGEVVTNHWGPPGMFTVRALHDRGGAALAAAPPRSRVVVTRRLRAGRRRSLPECRRKGRPGRP